MTTFMVNSSGKILRLLPGKNGEKISFERDPRTGQTRLTNNPEVDTVPDWQPLPSKVTICHKPGTPAQKTLEIPIQALAGHLGHGDTIGPCQ